MSALDIIMCVFISLKMVHEGQFDSPQTQINAVIGSLLAGIFALFLCFVMVYGSWRMFKVTSA
jgi:uncharacterized membrane protein